MRTRQYVYGLIALVFTLLFVSAADARVRGCRGGRLFGHRRAHATCTSCNSCVRIARPAQQPASCPGGVCKPQRRAEATSDEVLPEPIGAPIAVND